MIASFGLATLGMAALSPGSNVVVVGGGPIQALTGRISALRGFKTTLAVPGEQIAMFRSLVYDKAHPEGSYPLTLLPISGEEANDAAIDECVASINGLVVAFDDERNFMPEAALRVFSGGDNLQHVSLMSRSLNGEGMGFFANAAKTAANREIWAASAPLVDQLKKQEATFREMTKAKDATLTVVRAGTLKGGGSADSNLDNLEKPGGGEPDFLDTYFYSLGQQDAVNWRLLYDCSALAVELTRGDTMPGPGFKAALTACSAEGGDGDSHRGAVATALVEALRQPKAAGAEFSVASKKGEKFPSEAEWAAMFERA